MKLNSTQPRIVVIGENRDALGQSTESLVSGLRQIADIRHLGASGAPWSAPGTLMRASSLIREHGAELVHILDARYSAVGRWLQRRRALPVTVSVSSRDVGMRRGWPRVDASLGSFDAAFTSEGVVSAALRERHRWLDVHLLPVVARALPWPDRRRMAAITRSLHDVRPGRLIVAVPWTADRKELRWFRDEVMPFLDGAPLALIIGAPGRRHARLMFGAQGLQHDFRVHVGPLDVQTIAAAARCADLFAIPSGFGGVASPAASDLALAFAMGGVPVVTYGEPDARVLAHERNGFVVEPEGGAFIGTINRLLSLPAVQRHALGEDFARYTLHRWTWAPAAAVYEDRFNALVGRPRIPVEFRAAA